MTITFVRFKATDEVELQGWLNNEAGDTAVVHMHGMSGNGYENYFLDNLRETYAKAGMSLFTIDTRGRGIISSFWQKNKIDSWGEGTKLGGSCFEIFEESVYDIQGAINYLRTLDKSKFILEGHSLGCTKVVNFVLTQDNTDVIKVILLAPTDMSGWAKTDPNHEAYLQKSKELVDAGRGEELVAAQCWLDHTPLSAQTYPTICEAGNAADIYGEREGGALLGRINLPMLIPYGDDDIGITQIDGSMDAWLERVNKFKNANTKIAVVNGASHSFHGYEDELANIVEEFIR